MALGLVALLAAAQTDLGSMTDLGLPSALPVGYYVAVVALLASFCVTLSRRDLHVVALAVHVVALIAVIYGIAPLIEHVPRTATAWKLSGISDYVLVHGGVNPKIDAFFNWPGFFIVVALFTRLAGVGNPTDFAEWAPVFFNVLYLPPLFAIVRAATSDVRAPWLAVWLFLLANWIGQDYLAPQAASYFLFLVIMAILLTWFTRSPGIRVPQSGRWLSRTLRSWSAQAHRTAAASTRWQRASLLFIVVAVFAAVVPSHQLTPFASIAVVGALVLSGFLTTRGLPLLMVVLALTWIGYMTGQYLQGNFSHVVSPVGSLGSNVDANYTARVQGSSAHVFVVQVRSATSVFVWLLALAGAIRAARIGRLDLPSALMAITPFALLPVQTYGGELLLRVYLFSLPAMVLLGAKAFLPARGGRPSVPATVAIGVTSALILAGSLISRYGDERMHYFPPGDRAAVRELYDRAPRGARFVSLFDNVPWQYRGYDTYRYVSAERFVRRDGPGAVGRLLRSGQGLTYLLVTSSQLARGDLTAGWTPQTWPRLERSLRESQTIRKVFANDEGAVYLVQRPRPATARRTA